MEKKKKIVFQTVKLKGKKNLITYEVSTFYVISNLKLNLATSSRQNFKNRQHHIQINGVNYCE